MKQTTARANLVRQLLTEFPNRPKKQIARMAHDKNPAIWKDIEQARRIVRYYCGASGKDSLKLCDKSHVRPLGVPRDPWAAIPAPSVDLVWKPVKLPGTTILSIADLHVPYHDRPALQAALAAGAEAKVDTVLINGDLIDFYELSRFEQNPTRKDLRSALRKTYDILTIIRGVFADAKIIWKLGNHEERWQHYLWKKSPELCGMEVTKLDWLFKHPSAFGAKDDTDLQLTVIEDRVPLTLGYLYILHGHEFGKQAVFNPVNAARGAFLRAYDNTLVAHSHQTSSHNTSTISDNTIGTWSQGCLCKLRPRYMPINWRWNHGFAILRRKEGRNFKVENYKIIKGEVY